MSGELPGVVPSPNAWDSPDAYELLVAGTDHDGVL